MKTKLIIFLSVVIVFSCATATHIEEDVQSEEDIKTDWKNTIFKWDERIDYNNPEMYLRSGEISYISENTKEKLDKYFYRNDDSLTDLEIVQQIYDFMRDENNFTPYAAGGRLIAKRTAEEIFSEKTLSGCHDWGLVLSTVLRSYGIPAIFCDTALVSWAKEYTEETNNGFAGHIFVEAYINDRWVLLDSTSPEIIYEYDPMNPLLGFQRNDSYYYVMFKGTDPWDYGIYGNEDMVNSMKNSASEIVAEQKNYTPNGSPERLDEVIEQD